ncbi:MAG TPA: sigma-70 family RNA polymerase sigma factor [Thermoanaerobaculia bacterium]|jgi:RNA polymerase sigma factor (TIGR02999 family)|nr:sigma-70 family RNA polymerase sigma factor [Thermoanaerobaculia bacterium]
MSQVTQLLREWSAGRQEARDELLGLVYVPLRAIAERHLYREREGHTLQPTALVNELYLKLVDQRSVDWNDRTHFFAVAAQVMRRILVDHARKRKSEKRGGDMTPVTIGAALDIAAQENFDVVALDVALENLEKVFPQQARLVELRFYAGLTIDETAEVLGVSAATVSREWTMARAWLRRAMSAR